MRDTCVRVSMRLTHNHQSELESLLDRLSVHLIGQVGKADISGSIRKLTNTHQKC